MTRLDPVRMRLLRQNDVIPAETLREMADEIGMGWSEHVREFFLISVVCLALFAFAVIVGFVAATIKGTGFIIPLPVFVLVNSVWLVVCLVLVVATTARFRRIRRVMIRHLLCPHCGYDLRLLPTDPQDGATVCPECGCAWRLEDEAG